MKKLAVLLLLFLLTGCAGKASDLGTLTLNGDPETRILKVSTEIIPNCSVGGSLVKSPSMNISLSEGVEWEINGKVGVGTKVGLEELLGIPIDIPFLPIKSVDISGELGGKVANSTSQQLGQSTGWTLTAKEGYVYITRIIWQETWQPAYIDVLSDGKPNERIFVKYRSSIDAVIDGKPDSKPCDEYYAQKTQEPKPQASATKASQPPQVTKVAAGSKQQAVVFQDNFGKNGIGLQFLDQWVQNGVTPTGMVMQAQGMLSMAPKAELCPSSFCGKRISQRTTVETRMMLQNSGGGEKFNAVYFGLSSLEYNTRCGIYLTDATHGSFSCKGTRYFPSSKVYSNSINTEPVSVDLNSWKTGKIIYDPASRLFQFYLDDQLLGVVEPNKGIDLSQQDWSVTLGVDGKDNQAGIIGNTDYFKINQDSQ